MENILRNHRKKEAMDTFFLKNFDDMISLISKITPCFNFIKSTSPSNENDFAFLIHKNRLLSSRLQFFFSLNVRFYFQSQFMISGNNLTIVLLEFVV